MVTDNGSCFVSEEFETFLLTNGIKNITSAPYHLSKNCLAERAVQTRFKEREGEKHEDEIGQSDDGFVFHHRVQQANHQLYFQKCQIHTIFDLLKPGQNECGTLSAKAEG